MVLLSAETLVVATRVWEWQDVQEVVARGGDQKSPLREEFTAMNGALNDVIGNTGGDENLNHITCNTVANTSNATTAASTTSEKCPVFYL